MSSKAASLVRAAPSARARRTIADVPVELVTAKARLARSRVSWTGIVMAHRGDPSKQPSESGSVCWAEAVESDRDEPAHGGAWGLRVGSGESVQAVQRVLGGGGHIVANDASPRGLAEQASQELNQLVGRGRAWTAAVSRKRLPAAGAARQIELGTRLGTGW